MHSYSLIVCTYNRCSFLRETIESVLLQFADRATYELLIIDNNSSDDTALVVREFLHLPQVRYVLETSQGLSYARNRGIKEASKNIIVFLDDDIDLDANYPTMLDQIYSDPSIHIAGGKVLPYRRQMPDYLPRKYAYLVSVFDIGNEPAFVTKLMGANHSFRKEVAAKVGGYNISIGPNGDFKLGGDENEYLNRAQSAGYKLFYHPDLIVYHKIENRFSKEFILQYAYNIGASEANIDYLQRKWFLALRTLKYLANSILHRLNLFNDGQNQFVQLIKKASRKGYLDFVKKVFGTPPL